MDCGCNAPFIGPSLENTCGGGAFVLFMGLLDTFVRNRCDLSDPCGRVTPKFQPDAAYDFVVIGAGSGGAVAASRLSEVPNWKVLLIEAGADEPPGTQVPSMVINYHGTDIDWKYKTEPEKNACLSYPDKKCKWPRGKVLGGCSVINGMMYMRGTPKDYDDWESAGNKGWGFKDVLPTFKKSENNLEIGSLVDAHYHGKGGYLYTSRFPHQPAMAHDILLAGKELGYPISDDFNGNLSQGFTIAQSNHIRGSRLSSARAFLRPENVRTRRNLHIMLNSTATKLITSSANNKKTVTGVEFVYNKKKYTISVRKEVVLSGGSINSPQLLLLSGIGPKDDLRKVGVPVFHDLPGVGKNLQNHVAFYMNFDLKKHKAINDLDWAASLTYLLDRKGPLSSTGLSQVTSRLNSKYADPSGKSPDVQMFFAGYLAHCAKSGEVDARLDSDKPDAPRSFTISPVVLHPKSRGYLTLKSKDPFAHPLIYANYLSEPEDVATLIEAVRIAQRLGKTRILKEKYGIELDTTPVEPCLKNTKYDTDDYWACAVKHETGPENHQAGSCKMGPSTDKLAVVDAKLLVYGVDNLRVLDASVMPALVSGNTAATVMMIADRGSDFIKQRYLGPEVDLGNRGGFEEATQPSKKPSYATAAGGKPPKPGGQWQQQPPPHLHPHNPGFQHSQTFHQQHPHLPNPFPNQPQTGRQTQGGGSGDAKG